jgi:hypothetical protein
MALMALGGHRVGGLQADLDAYIIWLHDNAQTKAIIVTSIDVDLWVNIGISRYLPANAGSS